MSDDAFLISDIDDSEGDELSEEYKHDTIKVPDQANNSDAYFDYDDQKTKKTDSMLHDINEILISKEKDEKNNDKEEDNSNDDNYTHESNENNEKEDKNDEDIFVDISDENKEEKEKSEDEDLFANKSNEDNENENDKDEKEFTHKIDLNDKEKNENDEDVFVDKSDDNEEELTHKTEENNEDKFSNKSEENENDEDVFVNKNNEKEEESDKEALDNKSDENEEKEKSDNEDEKEDNEEKITNKTDENNEDENIKDSFVDKSDENEEAKRKIEDEGSNTNDDIANINESIFNADDEKEDTTDEISYKTNNNKDEIFTNESNEFADESYTGQNESNIPSDEIKNIEKNKVNKDNDKIKKSKKEKIETNKEDKHSVKPISEPSQQKNENPRSHRHLHKRKKEEIKKDKEQNEKQDQQTESIKPQKESKKYSAVTKNQPEINEEHDENKPNYTIDEITKISIYDGDYSYINQSNIQKVISKMRQRQRDALEVGDYELAKKAQLAIQSAARYYNEKQFLKHNSNRACEINVKLEQTRNDISFLQEHWSRVLENAKQKANDDLLQLRDKQDNALKEFDDKYKTIASNPEKNLPFEYRKFSSKVLALRKKQEIYANTNNFQMAKEINKEIKKLEEKEKKENFLRFQRKKIAERNNMIKKQDEMFAARKENWVRTIEGIKSVASYEIDHAKRSEKQLETKYMQTNEFSNKLIQQQQQRSSSLQPKKKDQQKQSQEIPNTTRENTKTVTHTQFTIQRNAKKVEAQEFRERAMINRIIYTNRMVPKVKKPVAMKRTGRQYVRTPR